MAGRFRTYIAQERAGAERDWSRADTVRPWLASLAAALTWIVVVAGGITLVALLASDATGNEKVVGGAGTVLATAALATIFGFIAYATDALDELLRR